MIALFEAGAFNARFIAAVSPRKSPYEPGSQEDRQWHLKQIIPIFVLFTKIAVNILF
jgi:hypothetical protein